MTSRNIRILVAAFSSLVAAIPALAHHAFEAEFDDAKNFSVTGVLTKIDWVNPHVYVYLDVKDQTGKVVNYAFESVPPLMLRKGGLERSTLVVGQTYSIDAYAAKDGSKSLGWLKTLHFPDGHAIDILRDEKKDAAK
jgi:hypothetical protein